MKGGTRKRGNTWSYYFDVGVIQGKRIKKEKGGFRTKKDAEKALTEALSEYNKTGTAFEPSTMLLADYLDLWLEQYARLNVRVTTYQGYQYVVSSIKTSKIAFLRLCDLSPARVQMYVNSLNEYSKGKIKANYLVLSSALNYAVYPMELIRQTPCQNIKLPQGKKTEPVHRYISPADFEKVASELEEHVRIPAVIAYYTGMRLSEVLGLTWDRVDFARKRIIVDRQLITTKKPHRMEEPKTPTSIRMIPINDGLIAFLSDAKAKHGQVVHYTENDRHEVIESATNDLDFVCRTKQGKYMNKTMVERALRPYDLTAHSLRHSHATILIESGVSPKTVQLRLGHASIQVTYDRYVHETDAMRQEAVAVSESIWFGGKTVANKKESIEKSTLS